MIIKELGHGYSIGTDLKEMTLQEARLLECNRCGGCCSGTLPDDVVVKDDFTGLPMFTWGEKFPEDLYASRYGEPLLLPIVQQEDGIGVGLSFDVDMDGKPHTCFTCSFHSMDPDTNLAHCGLIDAHGSGDPSDSSTIRPLNCGEFPVFGTVPDELVVRGIPFIPPTAHLPKCTWHGIAITGPWRDTPEWRDRWEAQQRGEDVDPLFTFPEDFIKGLEYKAKLRKAVEEAKRNGEDVIEL